MFNIINPLVNGLTNPLAIDTPAPRFTWQLTSERRGETPAACRVKVADSLRSLQEGRLLWDSGRRDGAQLHMRYEGPPLAGNSRYYWQACVWNEEERYAEMTPDWWESGLSEDDWQAKWIWRESEATSNDFTYFRRLFRMERPVTRAKLYISAHHVFQLYVNGERIGGYGSPAPTSIPRRKHYLAYDVSESLRSGDNCIGVIAHYLGGSGQNYVNGKPGLLLELHLSSEDGREEIVRTDTDWLTLRSSSVPHTVGTPYQQNRRLSAIEDYDASRLAKNWLLPEFPENLCAPAILADESLQHWKLRWQQLPEGQEHERIIPTPAGEAIHTADEGLVQVFDTGKIISGWPEIVLPGIAGTTVTLRYAEDLDDNGRVQHRVCNETSAHYFDRYRMHGRGGTEVWAPNLSYKAFRYVEVTGYPRPLRDGELSICSVHTGLAATGSFASSSAHLNKLYEACIQTQRNNIVGQVVDCPHREQAQYLTDTDLQAETLLYNFDAYHMMDKTLCDFADGQLKDGTFPFVYPSNYEHPDFYLQIPEWDLHFATLLWKLYQFSGDSGLLERYYRPLKKMLDAYMSTRSPETGLIPVSKGWHISDWPYPTVEHEGDYLTVQQLKAWQALIITADTARILGHEAESAAYAEQAKQLRDGILAHLYNADTKRLRDSSSSAQAHQGVNALALHAGILPPEDEAAVLAYAAGRPWESKTVLSLPLLRVLFDNGLREQAYRLMTKTEYPGWGYMIAQGATTMWEGWDDIESHCHAWNSYPSRMLQEYVCGIRSGSAGFASAVLQPYFAEGLSFAEAKTGTPRGDIALRWERHEDNAFTILLTLPCAMNATLLLGDLPDGCVPQRIVEGNVPLWDNSAAVTLPDGTVSCSQSETGLSIVLLSGTYRFTLHY
ncbi:glycoside hydrolase family 78 protein [Paenibacillus sp. J5C_2022]|uniref:alpha-L-rhamnosidase n=1 Tax=Paenibacillus sp. J5C2022 TaxID=2977129 RepID=UPI0021CF493A|nr:alpha-L-rhamnosidase [Paenibacillus sp. J5C2022]MCU6712508.1 glycoside hydrolase family 78 protein [Paenibacillus sp. J5C2022]